MKMRTSAKLAVAALCLAGASTVDAPGASAASGNCAGDATTLFRVAGQPVAVLDSTAAFASACLRVDSIEGGGTRTITIRTRLKDSAHDGQLAVGLVRFQNASGTWGSWQQVQAPTGTEDRFTTQVTKVFTMQTAPIAAMFAACRSTSSTGFPTNACA